MELAGGVDDLWLCHCMVLRRVRRYLVDVVREPCIYACLRISDCSWEQLCDAPNFYMLTHTSDVKSRSFGLGLLLLVVQIHHSLLTEDDDAGRVQKLHGIIAP